MGTSASFNVPRSIAIAPDGINLYAAETSGQAIRQVRATCSAQRLFEPSASYLRVGDTAATSRRSLSPQRDTAAASKGGLLLSAFWLPPAPPLPVSRPPLLIACAHGCGCCSQVVVGYKKPSRPTSQGFYFSAGPAGGGSGCLQDGSADLNAAGCIFDAARCVTKYGQCGILESDVPSICGGWSRCDGAVCKASYDGYCLARGSMSSGATSSTMWGYTKLTSLGSPGCCHGHLGMVTTVAGSGTAAYADGTGTFAGLNSPHAVVVSPDGRFLYVVDHGNHRIRKVVLVTGAVTTLAGSGNNAYADGTGAAASFGAPRYLEITRDGSALYVSDTNNNRIRKVLTSTGVTTTFFGSGSTTHADGTGTSANINKPRGLALSSDGTLLFVADCDNKRVRQAVVATGVVTTLAGSGTAANADGTGTSATFNEPWGLVAFGDTLYVSTLYSTGDNRIRAIVISTGAPRALTAFSPPLAAHRLQH